MGFNWAFERRGKSGEVSQIREIYFGWSLFPVQVNKQINKLGQQCSLPKLILLNWDPCTECSTAKQFFCCHRKSRGKVLNGNNDLTSSFLNCLLGGRGGIKPFLAFRHSDVTL